MEKDVKIDPARDPTSRRYEKSSKDQCTTMTPKLDTRRGHGEEMRGVPFHFKYLTVPNRLYS